MRTRPPSPRPLGFTLIEILVVLVIIGIIVTLAAVRFGGNDVDTLQREAERLSLLLESARDEAIVSGAPLAFQPGQRSYAFWIQKAPPLWEPINNDEVLRPRQLPDAVTMDGVQVNLQPLAPNGRLVFQPSGVNAPFALTLRTGDVTRRLVADGLGRLSIVLPVTPGASTP
ncbi:type II secretion system protein GspH [Chitinimonas arctica]|uniref:Type II secretion system protein H n=1 Tax=Chitinimonas arctica TaxID=2594795 RepID=A0A516SIJ8_9NEIS|nr:GspH/FimT family pseudopilin [Chitinimonas arctica]QDQ27972.1 type II secretion system protein GspH [Chitinimonas arctica]